MRLHLTILTEAGTSMRALVLSTMVIAAMTVETQAQRPEPATTTSAAAGPLAVSKVNPRYFTGASGGAGTERAIYLTGSHIWNNLHDGMGPGPACSATPERFDYDAYLKFLKERGHNFIRLWRWEQFQSQAAGGGFHLCMTPQPWARTGTGTAKDGKPRYDLTEFDQEFFDRLRQRVVAAGKEGIYVAVMLFDGWALHLSPAPDNVEGHPFHAANNINRVASQQSRITRCCRTRRSRRFRRRTSGRWSTCCMTSLTSSGKWRMNPRGAARSMRASRRCWGLAPHRTGATRPS